MKREKNKKLLFIMQIPPPITGATLRNSAIVDILKREAGFLTRLIPISFVKSVSDLSSFSLFKVFRSFVTFVKIIYQMIVFRPGIVYMTPVPVGSAYYRDLIMVFLVKLFRKKIIHHLRPLGFRSRSEASRIIKILNRFIFRNTSVICLSGITSKDVQGIYEGEPHILNNGIDVVDLEFGKKENKTPVILFFSNLFIAKGVFDFLETLSILRDRGVKFTGLIYGQEGDVGKQQLDLAIKDMALSDHVSYGGEVTGPEKYEIFQKSDILFFPTHIENFPGVVLEAMQLSLPVVSVYVGSIPEIVIEGETGYLYDRGDNIVAADRVEELISNTDLRIKMGTEGRKRFLNNYTLVIFKENLLKIINSEVRP